jgi:hypothetical protein
MPVAEAGAPDPLSTEFPRGPGIPPFTWTTGFDGKRIARAVSALANVAMNAMRRIIG